MTEYVVASRVPGSIHTDLQRNGSIGDPYVGYGDTNYEWIGKRDWTFEKQFEVTNSMLASGNNILLRADGIDTMCDVLVNDHKLGQTKNMHLGYTWPVRDVLLAGPNKVVIACKSPVESGAAQAKQYSYVVPPECPAAMQHGECHVNFLRKEASSFSWDWGPSFPTTGIWKSIALVGYNVSYAEHVVVNATKSSSDDWQVQLDVHFHDDVPAGAVALGIEMTELGINNISAKTSSGKVMTALFTVPRSKIELWWPNGYGPAKLYAVSSVVCCSAQLVPFARSGIV